MKSVFQRPKSLTEKPFHFCPGCHHGIAHRMVAEAIDYFGVKERVIGVASVGCSVFLYDYFDVDVIEAPHGRAAAVATGVKRARRENVVFTYQGDGDLASIGIAEVVHAANRGENITIFFVNNSVYGMTGGQMAPTTLLGQKTTTSPYGRDFTQDGYPIRMAEMLATLEGVAFAARVACNSPKNLLQAQKATRKAFEMQLKRIGFGFVEILSACPTNWSLSPLEAKKRIEEEMIPYYPLGIFKEREIPDYL
ncbi:MAG: 2-oxoglutarate oxidoreductase [Deltaproteobacteria bacterium]|nr:MAG: 2-oxoglutarate oxidoreductase [Deltaproteobacteria bacterium]